MPHRTPRKQRRKPATASAQLELDFSAGATVEPRVTSTPLERELLARAFERLAREEDDALLAAAVRRLRGAKPRSTRWVPPMLDLTPMSLLGWCAVKTAREWNDPALEGAGMRLMGYRLN